MISVNILSEIGFLQSVITRKPGREMELATPDKLEELLFEDIIDLPVIRKEHDVFTNCLKQMGIKVIDFDDLIIDVLKEENGKIFVKNILGDKIEDEKINNLFKLVTVFDIKEYLITGQPPIKELPLLYPPILNFMFTRDMGAIMKNCFLFATASKKARTREMRIARETLRFHRRFRHISHISYSPSYSLEGGDIEVLNEEIVVLGISERTSRQAIEMIVPQLHQLGFNYIVTVNLGNKRACMHLDTVFTMINFDECLIFEPIISKARIVVYKQGKNPIETKKGLLHTLSDVGIKLQPILCGGNDELYQIREQWTDGANSLTVRPGCIFVYRRNRRTIEELKKHGYKTIRAEDVHGPLPLNKKYVIILNGSELSRGRGESHCLSFPLNRT